ncbi:hypothetical protein, partial [Enterococcus sp. HMSC077E04]|uniref:hypothetical protein n=1 Tax=Enterococcus sp. HMSC077E04 TaxID=1715073 RepID=UPI001C402424
VQKLASAVISPPNKKYEELFLLAVLILDAEQLFHNLSYTVFNQLTFGISSKNGKICETIFPFVSLILRSKH